MTKKQRRRYYLHGRVKPIVRISVKQRTMFAAEPDSDKWGKAKKYVDALRKEFDYALQIEIPQAS